VLTLACLDLTLPAVNTLIAAHATDADRRNTEGHWRPHRRLQSLAGRALLRRLAAGIASPPPDIWDIRPSADMQPELVAPDGTARLDAALAHSRDRVAAALSDQGPIGIDLEQIRPEREFAEMARLAFGPRECQICAQAGGAAFYRIWTLREALAKACGVGFPMVVDGQDYFPEASAANLWQQTLAGRSWVFATRLLPGDYAFALALPAGPDAQSGVAAALDTLGPV
jgi:4'-phosphopantetheinyl transferase